jgi:hypothetical protein
MKIRCGQCEIMIVNGHIIHEFGCSDGHIDLRTGKPRVRVCGWCGCQFVPENREQRFCGCSCAEAYSQ